MVFKTRFQEHVFPKKVEKKVEQEFHEAVNICMIHSYKYFKKQLT